MSCKINVLRLNLLDKMSILEISEMKKSDYEGFGLHLKTSEEEGKTCKMNSEN